MKPLQKICCQLINTFLCGEKYFALKRGLLRLAGAQIGKNVRISGPFLVSADLHMDNGCVIGPRFCAAGNGKIVLGQHIICPSDTTLIAYAPFQISLGDHCKLGINNQLAATEGNIIVKPGTELQDSITLGMFPHEDSAS